MELTNNPFAEMTRPLVLRPGQYIPDPQQIERARRGEARRKESRFPAVANPWSLSPTEHEILRIVTEIGVTYTEVARMVHMADKTVGVHMMRARDKMAAKSTMHAVLMFDRWKRGTKPVDVELVVRFVDGKASVDMREVRP